METDPAEGSSAHSCGPGGHRTRNPSCRCSRGGCQEGGQGVGTVVQGRGPRRQQARLSCGARGARDCWRSATGGSSPARPDQRPRGRSRRYLDAVARRPSGETSAGHRAAFRKGAGRTRPPPLPRCWFSAVPVVRKCRVRQTHRRCARHRAVSVGAQGWVGGPGCGPCSGLTGRLFGGRTSPRPGQQP